MASNTLWQLGIPNKLDANVFDCDFVVSEFEL